MNDANVYCTIDDIRDVLSSVAVTLATSDGPPSDYGNCIAKAGSQIDKYCYKRYAPADLANSPLIRDWAAIFAAFCLMVRRGNPPPGSLAQMRDEAIADLTEIKKGLNEIPGIAPRKSYVPVLIVKRSTLRPYPRGVVERSMGSSVTGGPEHYIQKNNDAYDRFGWNSQAFLDYAF